MQIDFKVFFLIALSTISACKKLIQNESTAKDKTNGRGGSIEAIDLDITKLQLEINRLLQEREKLLSNESDKIQSSNLPSFTCEATCSLQGFLLAQCSGLMISDKMVNSPQSIACIPFAKKGSPALVTRLIVAESDRQAVLAFENKGLACAGYPSGNESWAEINISRDPQSSEKWSNHLPDVSYSVSSGPGTFIFHLNSPVVPKLSRGELRDIRCKAN